MGNRAAESTIAYLRSQGFPTVPGRPLVRGPEVYVSASGNMVMVAVYTGKGWEADGNTAIALAEALRWWGIAGGIARSFSGTAAIVQFTWDGEAGS